MNNSFQTILIANRGEIAVRIMRTARQLGYTTVAIYSDIDSNARHVQFADRAVPVGGCKPADSYLNIQKVLSACTASGADAVHPGYGFLSENAEFARACTGAGLVFIGPPAKAIHLMGNKSHAKELMLAAGVPCVPGYQGTEQSLEFLLEKGCQIGFPVMIKAAAGGGGRGLRIARDRAELSQLLQLAREESLRSFGSPELLLETAIQEARHIEIQVMADNYGNVIHLGERDCSIQRRHQKIFEESPGPAVTESLREQMGAAAVRAAGAIGYSGAGTVEFLLDSTMNFYFLEMNTRLQVEHPVTEMVSGIDLVEWQLRIARGEPLPVRQDDVQLKGHAIEARLYAEDPLNDFLPVAGDIVFWEPASNEIVRTDHGLNSTDQVSAYYDPLLAKIISRGDNRTDACRKLLKGLKETTILGIRTNREFLIHCLSTAEFTGGQTDTTFVDRVRTRLNKNSTTAQGDALELICLAAAILCRAAEIEPELRSWCNTGKMHSLLRLSVDDGELIEMEVDVVDNSTWQMRAAGLETMLSLQCLRSNQAVYTYDGMRRQAKYAVADNTVYISNGHAYHKVKDVIFEPQANKQRMSSGDVVAPCNGLLTDVLVVRRQTVDIGAPLCTIESMKLIQTVIAPVAGTVSSIEVTPGMQVSPGQLLIRLLPADIEALADFDPAASERQSELTLRKP